MRACLAVQKPGSAELVHMGKLGCDAGVQVSAGPAGAEVAAWLTLSLLGQGCQSLGQHRLQLQGLQVGRAERSLGHCRQLPVRGCSCWQHNCTDEVTDWLGGRPARSEQPLKGRRLQLAAHVLAAWGPDAWLEWLRQ